MANKSNFFSCNEVPSYKRLVSFVFTILLCPLTFANFDSARNTQLEKRLHKIYVDNYSQPVVDSEWFKFVEAIEEQVYTVRPGDTLWSISKVYFGDGFYWSKLWSVNQNITNPHLIHVNDKIYFKAGSFNAPPNIRVEKGEEERIQELLADDVGTVEITAPIEKPARISPMFKEYVNKSDEPLKEEEEDKVAVIIENRPKLNVNTQFTLTEELLNRGPGINGKIVSLGNHRKISGFKDRIFVESVGDGINTGDVVSIIRYPVDSLAGGFHVRVLGLARIEGLSEGRTYKARVIEQYFDIPVGSQVSRYQPPVADLRLNPELSSIKADVIPMDKRHFWAEGQVIFLKSQGGSFNPGETIKIFNRYDEDFDTFYNSGLVKIVSSSPPYGTAVVVDSKTALTENSETGW